MFVRQLGMHPESFVTTSGPEVESLRKTPSSVFIIPYLFSWIGLRRVWNPLRFVWASAYAAWLAAKLRPKRVISFGASDVVPFCYWACLFGAEVYHVECMNQVESPSVTGRLLYPICRELYVQWEGLLRVYGPKARYAGWVL